MKNRVPLTTALFLAAALFATAALPSQAAAADKVRTLVCFPGGPGSTAEAAPRLANVFARMEKLAGWEAGRLEGVYHNTEDACALYLKEHKPQLAILSLGMYLGQGDELKAEPLLEVLPVGGQRDQYRVIVESDPAADVAALAGKTLAGEMLGDAQFVSKIVFKGDVDAKSHFKLKRTRTPLRAIKLVHKGRAAAALLDAVTFAELGTLPFGAQMKAVYTSDPIPGWPFAALGDAKPGDRLSAADKKALIDALGKVCDGAAQKKDCEGMRLGGFAKVDAGTYADARKLYGTK